MENNLTIGRAGEEIACEYLASKGFRILERNFRRPWGELDIIARDKNKTLVFVEVKTMRFNGSIGSRAGESGHDSGVMRRILPEDNMTRSKLRKTQKIAVMYANANPESVDENAGWRVDLVAISIFGSPDVPLTDLMKNCEIKYFENVE